VCTYSAPFIHQWLRLTIHSCFGLTFIFLLRPTFTLVLRPPHLH